MVEPDPDERPPGVERVVHQLQHRRPLLEHGEQPPAGFELVGAHVVEQRRRTADVERLCRGSRQLDERRLQRLEEGTFAGREADVLELLPHLMRSEPDAGQALVQVLVRPSRQTRVDRGAECE